MIYTYQIINDKPAQFLAVVRNAFGEEKFRIENDQIFKQGIMKDSSDLNGLYNYLKEINVIFDGDSLQDFARAEAQDIKESALSGEYYEKGGNVDSSKILEMLNSYEPPFDCRKELAYKEALQQQTDRQNYFVDLQDVSDVIVEELRQDHNMEAFVNNMKAHGSLMGFDRLIYEVIIDQTPQLLTIKAIELL